MIAAIIAFAKGFSLDLLQPKIRVNVLSPGTVETPVFGKFIPESQIESAVYLTSDDSSFMLGAEILVDGGAVNLAPAKF